MKAMKYKVEVKTSMQSSERENAEGYISMHAFPHSVLLSSQSSPLQSDLLCHCQPYYIIFQDPLFPVFILNMQCLRQQCSMGKEQPKSSFERLRKLL